MPVTFGLAHSSFVNIFFAFSSNRWYGFSMREGREGRSPQDMREQQAMRLRLNEKRRFYAVIEGGREFLASYMDELDGVLDALILLGDEDTLTNLGVWVVDAGYEPGSDQLTVELLEAIAAGHVPDARALQRASRREKRRGLLQRAIQVAGTVAAAGVAGIGDDTPEAALFTSDGHRIGEVSRDGHILDSRRRLVATCNVRTATLHAGETTTGELLGGWNARDRHISDADDRRCARLEADGDVVDDAGTPIGRVDPPQALHAAAALALVDLADG